MNIPALICTVLLSLTLFAVSVHAVERSIARDRMHEQMEAEQNKRVVVFIELKTPSVAEYAAKYHQEKGVMPSKADQIRHSEALAKGQDEVMAFLATYGALHLSNFKVSANGIKCRVEKIHFSEIQAHPLVKSISAVPVHEVKTISGSGDINGAQALRNLGLTGKGKVIAILGSGINYELEAFGGAVQFSSSGPNSAIGNDPNIVELGSFPTDKVIAGIDLAGANYISGNENNLPVEDPDPFPFNLHETYAAGIAAGQAVEGRVLPGVAPDAKLIAVKILGDSPTETRTGLIAEGIEYALDPNRDGSWDDKADVINISIGGEFASFNNVNSIAAKNAVSLGVVVVASAGNDGNVPFILGSPASDSSVIAVGSHDSVRETSRAMNIEVQTDEGPKLYPVGSRLEWSENLAESFSSAVVMAEPFDTCEPLLNDVEGKVVLFQYQRCANVRVTQWRLAKAAGAVASIHIVDEVAPAINLPRFFEFEFPVYSISSFHGNLLMDAITANPELLVIFDSSNYLLDPLSSFRVSDFSSRGPVTGPLGFKPDVLAPGRVSAAGIPEVVSGTSFATPFVAGLAAALLEKHPSLSPAEIKALIMNSTVPSRLINDPDAPPFPLALQGTGIVRSDVSAELSSLVTPGGLHFGSFKPVRKQFESREVTLKNLTGERRYFKVSVEDGQANPGVQLRVPRLVHLPPHASKKITVRMAIDPRKLIPDTGGNQLIEADGWLVFEDDYDTLRVGYMAVVEPSSAVDIVHNASEAVVLLNHGFIETKAEAFSSVMSSEENGLTNKAGYRVKILASGEVETSFVFLMANQIQRFLREKLFIDFAVETPEGSFEPFGISVAGSVPKFPEIAKGLSPVHELNVSVGFDPLEWIEDATVEADFNTGWVKVVVTTSAETAFYVNGDEPAFAFIFDSRSSQFADFSFDPKNQIKLDQEEWVVPAFRPMIINKVQDSESVEGFILVHKNVFGMEALDL